MENNSSKAATNVSIYQTLNFLGTICSSFFGAYLLNYYSDVQVFRMAALLPILTLIAGLIATEPNKKKKQINR